MKWESVLLIFKTMNATMMLLRKQSIDVWGLIHKYSTGTDPVSEEFRAQAMKLLGTLSEEIKSYYDATEDLVQNFPYVKVHGSDLYEAYKETEWMIFDDKKAEERENEPNKKSNFQPNFMQTVRQV